MPALLVLWILAIGTVVYAHEWLLVAASSGDEAVVATGVSVSAAFRRRRGRPRKFAAPSRAVTLTLPESVIQMLSELHHDLSRAVVGLTQRRATTRFRDHAELVVFGRRAVITVRPTPSLESRAGVHLVPLPNGRALISFDAPRTLAELELTLADALEDPTLTGDDRKVFEGINAILKDARRSKDVALLRRNIIVLESAVEERRPAKNAATATIHFRKG